MGHFIHQNHEELKTLVGGFRMQLDELLSWQRVQKQEQEENHQVLRELLTLQQQQYSWQQQHQQRFSPVGRQSQAKGDAQTGQQHPFKEHSVFQNGEGGPPPTNVPQGPPATVENHNDGNHSDGNHCDRNNIRGDDHHHRGSEHRDSDHRGSDHYGSGHQGSDRSSRHSQLDDHRSESTSRRHCHRLPRIHRLMRSTSHMSLASSTYSRDSHASQSGAISNHELFPILERIVKSAYFDIGIALCIVGSTITAAVEMQCLGLIAGRDIQYPGASVQATWVLPVVQSIDRIFTWVFAGELVLRIMALRCAFLRGAWNLADSVIVVLSLFETLSHFNVGVDPKLIRLLRLMKVLRFLRMMKVATVLDSLNLMLKSVIANCATLLWSMMLLVMFQVVAGMILNQMVQAYLLDDSEADHKRRAVYEYYGTFTKTMITMFEITHTNYANASRVLIDNISEIYAWFIISYRVLVSFSVISVVQSVFIQQTLAIAETEKNPEVVVKAKKRQQNAYTRKLETLFTQIDKDNVGSITATQFKDAFSNESFKMLISAVEIDPRDGEMLFELIDSDGSGRISLEEFISGASRLRGSAKAIDLIHVMSVVRRVEAILSFPSALPDAEIRQMSLDGHMPPVADIVSCSSKKPALPAEDEQASIEERVAVERIVSHTTVKSAAPDDDKSALIGI